MADITRMLLYANSKRFGVYKETITDFGCDIIDINGYKFTIEFHDFDSFKDQINIKKDEVTKLKQKKEKKYD